MTTASFENSTEVLNVKYYLFQFYFFPQNDKIFLKVELQAVASHVDACFTTTFKLHRSIKQLNLCTLCPISECPLYHDWFLRPCDQVSDSSSCIETTGDSLISHRNQGEDVALHIIRFVLLCVGFHRTSSSGFLPHLLPGSAPPLSF